VGEERGGDEKEGEGVGVGEGNNRIQSQELVSPFWNSNPVRNLLDSALKGTSQGNNIPYITLQNSNHI